MIVHTFNYQRDFHIPADEVSRTEAARTLGAGRPVLKAHPKHTMSSSTLSAGAAAPVFYDDGTHHPEHGTLLGFWLYLMSDCLIFAVLFAVYAVLGRNYAGGPTGAELFDLPLVAANTAMLLLSSITYGLAMIAMQHRTQVGRAGLAGDDRPVRRSASSRSSSTSSRT